MGYVYYGRLICKGWRIYRSPIHRLWNFSGIVNTAMKRVTATDGMEGYVPGGWKTISEVRIPCTRPMIV